MEQNCLPICTMSDHFPDFPLAIFLVIESQIIKQMGWQAATEEPNRG